MRRKASRLVCLLLAVCLVAGMLPTVSALNPAVQSWYTADPSPVVFSNDPDTLWVFTSHDEDYAHGQNIGGYNMKDYKCFSTKDMVNWTYRGTPVGHQTFSTWSKDDGSAWAQQVVERNGKYYCYAPIFHNSKAWCIGVAVADSPEGPYVDAINKPLYDAGWSGIDPTVFIDDDGQAYMYWGNPTLYCAKLNEDMVTLGRFTQSEVDPSWATIRSDGTLEMKMTIEAFGWGGDKTDDGVVDAAYQEGPWFFKRDNTYYMVYPSIVEGSGESMSYSTSPGPIGPWTYRGVILDTTAQGEAGFNSYTIHGGTVDFKGHSYLFYHNGMLPGGGSMKRSIAIEEFQWNADGSIPYIPRTTEGVKPVETLDPYALQQAETIAWSEGIRPIERSDGVISVQQISNNDSIRVMNVDFGAQGAAMFTATVAAAKAGASVDILLDSKSGTKLATLAIPATEGAWVDASVGLGNAASGVHDLYFVFHGNSSEAELFEMDTWQFTQKAAGASDKTVIGLNLTADTYTIDTEPGRDQANITVTAIYADGTTADVSKLATLTGDAHASASGSVVTGTAFGTATITATYQGRQARLSLTVKDMGAMLRPTALTASETALKLYIGGSKTIALTATFADGHTEDVTADAIYASSDPAVVTCEAGRLAIHASGETTLTITYQGKLGEAKTITLPVTVGYRDPFQRIEAESYDERVQRSGNVLIETATTDTEDKNGRSLGYIQDRDWIRLSGVKFTKAAKTLTARVASASRSFSIEFRKNAIDGELIGRITGATTGSWDNWDLRDTTVNVPAGEQFDLYVVFANGDMDINWLQFGDGTTPLYPEIDPYRQVEAETFVGKKGEDLVVEDKGSYQNVGYISDGDWIKYPNVNFGFGAVKIDLRAAFAYYGDTRTIRLRLDSPGAADAAVLRLEASGGTGGFESYRNFSFSVDPSKLNGAHDLYFYFDNGNVNIDWWRFEQRQVSDAEVAAAVSEKIAAIGEVTLDSAAAIEAARRAYDALSAAQKALVDHAALTAAEAALQELRDAAAKAEADRAAAAAVDAKIRAIGTVTLESEAAIQAARSAYNALSAEQQALVTERGTLEAAEDALEALQTPVVLPFRDVTGWYEEAVRYVYGRGLMNGTSATLFSPNGTLTRAQLVTVLYRVEGEPKVAAPSSFTDVPAGQWYSDAIAWASANGIVNGVNEREFRPMNKITREQIAAILFRYTKGAQAKGSLDQFPDKDAVSPYAVEAMTWATEQGLITGIKTADGPVTLSPRANATRAQIAALIMRYMAIRDQANNGNDVFDAGDTIW